MVGGSKTCSRHGCAACSGGVRGGVTEEAREVQDRPGDWKEGVCSRFEGETKEVPSVCGSGNKTRSLMRSSSALGGDGEKGGLTIDLREEFRHLRRV